MRAITIQYELIGVTYRGIDGRIQSLEWTKNRHRKFIIGQPAGREKRFPSPCPDGLLENGEIVGNVGGIIRDGTQRIDVLLCIVCVHNGFLGVRRVSLIKKR